MSTTEGLPVAELVLACADCGQSRDHICIDLGPAGLLVVCLECDLESVLGEVAHAA